MTEEPTTLSTRFRTLAAAAVALAVAACSPADDEPRLVVNVVVDQLTPELLERYDEAWNGGFRRLLDGGRVYEDAVHDHAVTFTSPGHATPTTGVVPARHGVVANSWYEREEGEWTSVSSVGDPDTERVGGSGSGSSPHNLRVDGLPDWLLEHHEDARVVSLSGKSTAGVLMAGRASQAHAYWFSSGDEGFVTSSHYRDELPGWVAGFNEGVVEEFAAEPCWEDEVPRELADLSRRDTVDYEADGTHTHFPHCVEDDPYDGSAHFISRTPALDAATLALAREAVEALEMGGGEAPDYLALALSATDRVGHTFGPYSREQLDNLIRLDRELGRFLDFLDEAVGPDRYAVALTSDHGVLPLPEYLAERGEPGGRLDAEYADTLEAVAERVGAGPPQSDGGGTEARERMAAELEQVEWVEAAYPLELLEGAGEAGEAEGDPYLRLYRNSFHPERVSAELAEYGVAVQLAEGMLTWSSGTTHGAPYRHDRHVPLLFYGAGVGSGADADPVRTVDVAPTLSELMGVPVPDGLDGRPLRP